MTTRKPAKKPRVVKAWVTRFWRYRIPRRPLVWWYVMGRKTFAPTFPQRRDGWQCSRFPTPPQRVR